MVLEEFPLLDAYGELYRSRKGAPYVEIRLVEDANFRTELASEAKPEVLEKSVQSPPDASPWFATVL